MHYTSYRRDGSVIGDFRHGCWGMLSTYYANTRSNGGIDKIYWEIERQEGINAFIKHYGCTAQEFFMTLLKGYDVEFEMSGHKVPQVTGIYIKNLWNRNPQETMLRLFGLRTATSMYSRDAMVKLCKEHGLPLTAAVVISNCFAPKSASALNNSGPTSITPCLDNGGNIGYYNTCVSDFRRFLKGDFTPNKKLIGNDTTWGEVKGYTSGNTGRYVQEACTHAPLGSALLAGWFYTGDSSVDQNMYEYVYMNREGNMVKTILGSKFSMDVKEFFTLMKAILNKKKLPVQRGLEFFRNNNTNIPLSVRERVNPFFKNIEM